MKTFNKIKTELDKNSSAYRAKPFWAWNGKLDPAELRRQIRIMKKMGLGGFFMHSRVGLDTPYLSGEWFECVDTCVAEAKKLGMEAWLYDEDRWPSGSGGGLVTSNPEFQMRVLECEVLASVSEFKWDDSVVAAFSAKIEGENASEVKRIKVELRPDVSIGHELLVFRVVVTASSDWYNGQTYLDTMNPKAVESFIEKTHEQYKKRFGNEFGRTIPGIFTDEPHHGSAFGDFPDIKNQKALPWTARFTHVFKHRYGYDITDHLVKLFYNVDGRKISPIRHNYHDCATYLFTESFAKTIGKWCDEAGILSTGHVLYESPVSEQASAVGSAMRSYEYMQAPGMDLLTEVWREFDTAKQVSSVARQFGRKWRLTETYGCTGWQFPFSGHKALGDWQLALGINLRCQHLYWYTMEGEAKRDYPASIASQSPWWEIYSKVEGYFARTHAIMTRGREVRDLLVIHPIESTWAIFNPDWKKDKEIQLMDKSLVSLRDSLLGENIDFDYGDEDILSRHAKVEKRKGQLVFKVGEAEYTTILVPPMLTMRSTTLNLLEQYRQAGGKVVFAGRVADYLDVEKSDAVKDFATLCSEVSEKGGGLVEGVENCRRVSISDTTGRQIPDTLYLLREDKDAWYLFVCNYGTDYTKAKKEVPVVERKNEFTDVRIRGFEGADSAVEMDSDSGEWYAAKTTKIDAGIEIHTSLEQLGSRIFVIPKQACNIDFPARASMETVSSQVLKPAAWDISLSESNNLVLDRPAYRIGKGDWNTNKEILQIDRAVRDVLKLKYRGGQMCQPWVQKKQDNPKSVSIELAYRFEVDAIPSGEIFVGIERAGLYRIFINGNEVSSDGDCGWWVDKSLRRLEFSAETLVQGENELRLVCDYNECHPGLEIVYLLGNFGTKVCGTNVSMVEFPRKLEIGDWTKQGLAFYSGAVSYRTTIKIELKNRQRLILRVPSYDGSVVRVWVDGKPADIIAWQPNEVDITDYLADCQSEIAIEVFSHRANSHGPLHLNDKQPDWTGPLEFVAEGDGWKDNYRLLACGLTSDPELIVKQ